MVESCSGDQGDDGHDQVAGGGVAADTGHELGVKSGQGGAPEKSPYGAQTQSQGQIVDGIGPNAAQGAEHSARAVDIEENAEGDAAGEGSQAVEQQAVRHHSSALRQSPQQGGGVSGSGGAQGHGAGNEQDLDAFVNAGAGVPVDHVPQGVGEYQARHQKHHGANDDGVAVLGDPRRVQAIGQPAHKKGGGQRAEHGLDLQPVQNAADEEDHHSAETGQEGIRQGAAEKGPEACRAQKVAQKPQARGIVGDGGQHLPEHLLGPFRLRPLGAEPPGQGIEPLHGVQVVAVKTDPPHPCDGLLLRGENTDDQVPRHRRHLRLQAIGLQDPPDRILHPVGLRAADGQMVAQVRGEV